MLKVGDRVAIPFAETKDTCIIRHGVIDHISENRLIYGIAIEFPDIGRCVVPQTINTLLLVDAYPDGSIVTVDELLGDK